VPKNPTVADPNLCGGGKGRRTYRRHMTGGARGEFGHFEDARFERTDALQGRAELARELEALLFDRRQPRVLFPQHLGQRCDVAVNRRGFPRGAPAEEPGLGQCRLGEANLGLPALADDADGDLTAVDALAQRTLPQADQARGFAHGEQSIPGRRLWCSCHRVDYSMAETDRRTEEWDRGSQVRHSSG
jgi:hypothetical protein